MSSLVLGHPKAARVSSALSLGESWGQTMQAHVREQDREDAIAAPANAAVELPARPYWRSLLSPAYHLRKIREDLGAAWHGLRHWNLDQVRACRTSLAQAFRGRLFATFWMAGSFAFLGPLTGAAAQALTHSPWIAMTVTFLSAQVYGLIGYQLVWAIAHRRLYRQAGGSRVQKFLRMQRDLLPIQLGAFKIVAVMSLIALPLNSLLIGSFSHFWPEQARYLPVPIIMPVIEFFVIQATLIRLMGDLFERHSWRLADRHLATA